LNAEVCSLGCNACQFDFIQVLLLHTTTTVKLSTHADRQGVDISVTVVLCVCTVTDFSAKDKG